MGEGSIKIHVKRHELTGVTICICISESSFGSWELLDRDRIECERDGAADAGRLEGGRRESE